MSNLFEKITIEVLVQKPIEMAWRFFNDPAFVTQWNHASDDWHSPRTENDLRPGGHFNYRMEAKDGSFGFDFAGTYTQVVEPNLVVYTIGDGRQVTITFTREGEATRVVETFEAETENSLDLQRQGWQAILDHYKRFAESQ